MRSTDENAKNILTSETLSWNKIRNNSPTQHDTHVLAYAQTWEEVVASFVSASVTAGIVFLAWYTVAPLFGYTLEERRLDYDDYSGYYNNYYQEDPANNYYYYQGRSLQDTGLVTRAAKMLFNRYNESHADTIE